MIDLFRLILTTVFFATAVLGFAADEEIYFHWGDPGVIAKQIRLCDSPSRAKGTRGASLNAKFFKDLFDYQSSVKGTHIQGEGFYVSTDYESSRSHGEALAIIEADARIQFEPVYTDAHWFSIGPQHLGRGKVFLRFATADDARKYGGEFNFRAPGDPGTRWEVGGRDSLYSQANWIVLQLSDWNYSQAHSSTREFFVTLFREKVFPFLVGILADPERIPETSIGYIRQKDYIKSLFPLKDTVSSMLEAMRNSGSTQAEFDALIAAVRMSGSDEAKEALKLVQQSKRRMLRSCAKLFSP